MSTQTQHSLEAAERSGDEGRLAEELRKAKPDVAPTVIGILERARSPRVRNAAALALADMQAANARDSLIGALRRAETKGHRGTILYALDELGANLPLSLLAGIIAGDPYEAREEALGFLASSRVDRDVDPRRVERMLRSALKGADEERSHAIGEALGYLSEHFKGVRVVKNAWSKAILSVGDGRGFVVEGKHERYVITAAHCLPRLPPALGGISHVEERTYPKLLGAVGRKRRPVGCECVFVDPVADMAILGGPDGQELCDEATAYGELVGTATPLRVGQPAWEEGDVHLLPDGTRIVTTYKAAGRVMSLDGRWLSAEVGCVDPDARSFWIESVEEPVARGMSGSPFVTPDGVAFGVVVTDRGPQPNIVFAGPGWFTVERLHTNLLLRTTFRTTSERSSRRG